MKMKGKLKLFIDTSTNKKTVVKLGNKTLEKNSSVWHSQVVLPMIEELLNGRNLDVISEIELKTTGDSFTGLRVGASIANALGYAKKIKINHVI